MQLRKTKTSYNLQALEEKPAFSRQQNLTGTPVKAFTLQEIPGTKVLSCCTFTHHIEQRIERFDLRA